MESGRHAKWWKENASGLAGLFARQETLMLDVDTSPTSSCFGDLENC